MTIACPSCYTRYRYPHPPSGGGSRGQCSQCDEQFPLEQAPRSYIVLPARRMPIGMDDPSLAVKVETGPPSATAANTVNACKQAPTRRVAWNPGKPLSEC